MAIFSFFYGREGMPFQLRLCFPARQSHRGSCSSNSDEARESNSSRMIRQNQTEQLFGRLRTELCSPHFDLDKQSCKDDGFTGQRIEQSMRQAPQSQRQLWIRVFSAVISQNQEGLTDSTRMSRLYLSTLCVIFLSMPRIQQILAI